MVGKFCVYEMIARELKELENIKGRAEEYKN